MRAEARFSVFAAAAAAAGVGVSVGNGSHDHVVLSHDDSAAGAGVLSAAINACVSSAVQDCHRKHIWVNAPHVTARSQAHRLYPLNLCCVASTQKWRRRVAMIIAVTLKHCDQGAYHLYQTEFMTLMR